MKSLEELDAQVGPIHDAVLLAIDMRWSEGTVTLALRSASGARRIIVEQVTRMECPREYPWGPSRCINEVRFGRPPPNAAMQMEVEMQSGDVLVICGGDFKVED